MAHYNKGAGTERSLLKVIYSHGFSVMRAAGSGVSQMPSPDVVVLGKGLKLGVECKAWRSNYLNLSHVQMDELIDWGKRADAIVLVAWKNYRTPWVFLFPHDFRRTGKNYMISWKEAVHKGRSLEVVLGLQETFLK
jgi:Holliday junction resolvase